MKTALGTILIFAALVAQVFGANPAFQSFDTNDFIITPSLSNPKVIHANRFGVTNSFTNSVIIYSNTVVIMDGTNLAIINPTDTILPYRVNSNTFGDSSLKWLDTHSIQGTNFTTKSKLESDGSFVTGLSGNYILGAGPNTINLTNSAFVFLSSLSSAATIQLTTGSAVGARALLFNADTNFSLTLTNGPLVDDGSKNVYVAGGVWNPSQLGESIQIVYTASGWFEEGRMNPNTNNIVGTSHWTNAAGLLRPIDLYIPVAADSINATNMLSTDGSFLTRNIQAVTLVSGTNVLNPYNTSYFVLVSSDTNVTVQFYTGNGSGQHVWLLNFWTNATFTLPSGPLADDTNAVMVVRGGAWTPTEPGESLELLGTPNGWVEIGRSNPNGPVPALGTNYWTNILGTLKPIAEASGTNLFTIDANTGWTGTGTNWFGDDGKFHSTTFNTNGGNLSGSLSVPFLPYATGTDTLADSPVYRVDGWTVATTNFVIVNITNTGDFASGQAVYTFPATVGGGDFLMAGAVTVPTGFDPYYHVALEWRGATTNAITNITVQQITVQSNITINGTNVAAVNPTDGYLPVRASATSFQDSPVHILSPSLSDVIFDGKIIFGPGTTNTLYRSGNEMFLTNNSSTNGLQIVNGAGKTLYLDYTLSQNPFIHSGTGFLYTDPMILTASSIQPNGTSSLGQNTSSGHWDGLYVTNGIHLSGLGAGTPDELRLVISHDTTNIVFDSQATGTAGAARNFLFTSNGVTVAKIAANSGYAGGGTKFLSDDGTYKAGTGGSDLWTNNTGILQPNDLSLQPLVTNGWAIGGNTLSYWGGLTNGEALVAESDVVAGDIDYREIYIGAHDASNDGHVSIKARTGGGSMFITRTYGGTNNLFYIDSRLMSFKRDNNFQFAVDPYGEVAQPAALYFNRDTNSTMSADALLFGLDIGATNKMSVYATGAITTGGNTNRWTFKSVTEGATTNIVVNINGKDYTFIAF